MHLLNLLKIYGILVLNWGPHSKSVLPITLYSLGAIHFPYKIEPFSTSQMSEYGPIQEEIIKKWTK